MKFLSFFIFLILLFSLFSCKNSKENLPEDSEALQVKKIQMQKNYKKLEQSSEIILEKRAMFLQGFPCMSCHKSFENDKAQFPLPKIHAHLKFKHMDTIKNCYSCHDKKNRDLLHLIGGEKITFDESYKLCFQCHGKKKNDWLLGVHGKQVGSWNGVKFRHVCTSCHEAHHSKFPLMEADPGPQRLHKNKSNLERNH